MTTFFTSDTHYYHTNIIKYSKRPFKDVTEMNEAMIENHNSVVKPNDTVWNLGDFGFAKEDEMRAVLRRLNGHKHFIYGNHDKTITNNLDKFVGKPGMFESAQQYKEISINGQHIILLHYGMRVWNKSHHGSWQLYGHSHGSLPAYNKSTDVGVDVPWIHGPGGVAQYTPFSFEQIKRFMDSQTFEVVDHHGRKGDR